MKIKEIMNKVVVTNPNISLKHATKIMSKMGIGCLTIMKGKEIKGIITERDIMKNLSTPNKKISSVMTKNVVTMDLNQTLEDAAIIMTSNQIKRLIITEKGKIVGIITATDMIANSDLLNEDLMFY